MSLITKDLYSVFTFISENQKQHEENYLLNRDDSREPNTNPSVLFHPDLLVATSFPSDPFEED